jgi:uncharacterized protein YqjF (DUF2071 family)
MGSAALPTTQRRLDARSGESGPPAWTVGWRQAIFEHYRIVDPALIERALPDGLALDRHDDEAWLSVVSFRMTSMRFRDALPLPFASTYPQVNVRVYVVGPEGAPGVFFLRNLVGNRLAARAGRALYGMPYVYRAVTLRRDGDRVSARAAARPGETPQLVEGRPGEPLTGHEGEPSQLLFFLAERYPLFSALRGRLHAARMVHPPWPLRRLLDVERSHGAVEALGLRDALDPHDDVQFSPGVRVQMWPPRPVGELRD